MINNVYANRENLKKKFHDNPVPSYRYVKGETTIPRGSRFNVKAIIPKCYALLCADEDMV